jgi:hypothetical protein
VGKILQLEANSRYRKYKESAHQPTQFEFLIYLDPQTVKRLKFICETGKCCSTQVQGWAFKMKITPAISSHIGI